MITLGIMIIIAGFLIVITLVYIICTGIVFLGTALIRWVNTRKPKNKSEPITVQVTEVKKPEECGFALMKRKPGGEYQQWGFEEDYYLAYHRVKREREKDPSFGYKIQKIGQPWMPEQKRVF